MNIVNFTKDVQSTVWIGACRYYLGRIMTYAVGNFCDSLIRHWPVLPDHTRSIIQRDVEEEFTRDDAARSRREAGHDVSYMPLGHDCDRAEWEKVRRLWTSSEERKL